LLSLLFAYLLDPALTWVQQHAGLRPKDRAWATALVYLVGTSIIGGAAYKFGPYLVVQMKSLNVAVARIIEGLSNGNINSVLGGTHGLDAAQQLRIPTILASHSDLISRVIERTAASAASVAASAIWLFAIPVLAIFLLKDGRQRLDAAIEGLERRRRRTAFERICNRSIRCSAGTFAHSLLWPAYLFSFVASPCLSSDSRTPSRRGLGAVLWSFCRRWDGSLRLP
jgi:predicted PurR-regulated permease PerM